MKSGWDESDLEDIRERQRELEARLNRYRRGVWTILYVGALVGAYFLGLSLRPPGGLPEISFDAVGQLGWFPQLIVFGSLLGFLGMLFDVHETPDHPMTYFGPVCLLWACTLGLISA